MYYTRERIRWSTGDCAIEKREEKLVRSLKTSKNNNFNCSTVAIWTAAYIDSPADDALACSIILKYPYNNVPYIYARPPM